MRPKETENQKHTASKTSEAGESSAQEAVVARVDPGAALVHVSLEDETNQTEKRAQNGPSSPLQHATRHDKETGVVEDNEPNLPNNDQTSGEIEEASEPAEISQRNVEALEIDDPPESAEYPGEANAVDDLECEQPLSKSRKLRRLCGHAKPSQRKARLFESDSAELHQNADQAGDTNTEQQPPSQNNEHRPKGSKSLTERKVRQIKVRFRSEHGRPQACSEDAPSPPASPFPPAGPSLMTDASDTEENSYDNICNWTTKYPEPNSPRNRSVAESNEHIENFTSDEVSTIIPTATSRGERQSQDAETLVPDTDSRTDLTRQTETSGVHNTVHIEAKRDVMRSESADRMSQSEVASG